MEKGKQRAIRMEPPDKISRLPEEILAAILSFLPLKEAVKTTILSRRFINIWLQMRDISFNSDHFSERLGIPHDAPSTSRPRDEFTPLVSGYFQSNQNKKLGSIRLHVDSSQHYPRLEKWLDAAHDSEVEKLDLDLGSSDGHFMYEHKPSYRSKHLKLSGCYFMPPDAARSSPCTLVSIELRNVAILADDFVSFCPLLEKITLVNCHGLTELNIASPPKCLRYVKLIHSADFVTIYAKNLEHFECFGFREVYLHPRVKMDNTFHSRKTMQFHEPVHKLVNKCVYTPAPFVGRFKSLKVLKLYDANFPERHFERLVSNCSCVEELVLEGCVFWTRSGVLRLSGMDGLRAVRLVNCRGVGKYVVCATGLREFAIRMRRPPHHCFGYDASFKLLDNDGHFDCEGACMNLRHLHVKTAMAENSIASFRALETIVLEEMGIATEDLRQILTNCKGLKKFSIVNCCGFWGLEVKPLGNKLEKLAVINCLQLAEIEIDAPELVEFMYHGQTVRFSFRNVPKLRLVDMKINANNYSRSMDHVMTVLSQNVPELQSRCFSRFNICP